MRKQHDFSPHKEPGYNRSHPSCSGVLGLVYEKKCRGLMSINCSYIQRTVRQILPTPRLPPTICRSSVISQEHFGKCQRHPQKQCHHRRCSPPSVRRLPCGDYFCGQEVFEGENEGFVRVHHLRNDSENAPAIIYSHFVEISWHKALEVLALPHNGTFKALFAERWSESISLLLSFRL